MVIKMKSVVKILLLFIGLTSVKSSAAHVSISQNYEGFIGTSLSYYVDQQSNLSLSRFIQRKNANKLSNSDQEIFLRTSPIPCFWVTFSTNSTLSERVWLNLTDEVLEECHTGSISDRSTRNFDSNTFWFPIIAGNGTASYQFIFKIKTALAIEIPVESELGKGATFIIKFPIER
ncbi:MAG: hypothetical protein ACI8ZM_001653 [Crocinitomix sp.]|jgi:hypothetical protein